MAKKKHGLFDTPETGAYFSERRYLHNSPLFVVLSLFLLLAVSLFANRTGRVWDLGLMIVVFTAGALCWRGMLATQITSDGVKVYWSAFGARSDIFLAQRSIAGGEIERFRLIMPGLILIYPLARKIDPRFRSQPLTRIYTALNVAPAVLIELKTGQSLLIETRQPVVFVNALTMALEAGTPAGAVE